MWPNLQGIADLVTFTEKILNGKLHFFCSVSEEIHWSWVLAKDSFHLLILVKVQLMMIRRWIPMTSHNQVEIDHIRLVFFQIKVEKGKRSPPSFQFFVCFDVIRSEDQSQCMILSQMGPPGCASVILICSLDTKLYTTENRVDPSFLFQP